MRRMLFAAALVTLLTIAAQGVADEYWGDWTQMDPSDHPSARDRVHMAYDSESDRAILFGGYNEVYHFDDTWAYDDNSDTWEQMNPADRPSPRRNHPMAYDSGSDRIVLFGGFDGYDYLGDTWAYDCNTDTWERMHPADPPTGISLAATAYDSESDRVILFGGFSVNFLDDTWAYDYDTDTWTKMNPLSSPSPRSAHAMVYDAESDRVILFGGQNYGVYGMNDTWAYDYNSDTWEEMHPPAHPSDRSYLHMAYLAEADRAILFGGQYYEGQVEKYHADTWAYDFDADTWEELVTPSHPCARRGYAFACVDEDNRVALFGGRAGSSFFDDTWVYGAAEICAPWDWLWPGWNWIAIPGVPYDPDPTELFGFDCGGRLWYFDKYGKWHQVYRPPFVTFEMEVGPSYLMWLDDFPPPVSYDGYPPDMPFEFKMGRMGWTWLGKPGLQPLGAGGFMDTVMVRYPSDESGELRTAREDWESGDPWLSWGWAFWDPYAQAPRTFTPYLPWHNVCYPWCGYRCWVTVGAALDESDPDQVTLIWP